MTNLIINGDDFGLSTVFNRVILDLIKDNKIKSTTVMVDRMVASDIQAKQTQELIDLRATHNLSVGLHLEFTDSDYKSQTQSQFNKFKSFFATAPSHLDVHKANSIPECQPIVAGFCREHGLPKRYHEVPYDGVVSTDGPAFFGSVEKFADIEQWISTLKGDHFFEILFHPGQYDPNCQSSLNKDRERDVIHIQQLNSILSKYNITSASYLDLIKSRNRH
ncbi:MAG: ChbG/HpnK family deacetylase [Candidatus Kuenenbacteria bacterium]